MSTILRLGLFGGTFDPPHLGHLAAASEAAFALDLDRVLFVPAARPWQKRAHAPAEDRLHMTIQATAGYPRFEVSRIELDRPGETYSVDTLEALRSFYGSDVELWLVVGADAAAGLGTWHRIEDVADLAGVCAVSRPGAEAGPREAHPGWPRIELVAIPALDVSSSDIRTRVAGGRPFEYLVPRDVARHIVRRGLYSDIAAQAS